ncbi:type I secretion system permease/ATPase [Azotosporobacter soli]|uniref:peptidase domain-containing ABC transporter n=1 Tax=Azotosporobacter soli TaxID=3055040 RepID=UPI0031FF071A
MAEEGKQGQEKAKNAPAFDAALDCLCFIAGLCGVNADEKQIRRANIIKAGGMDLPTLVGAARQLGLKARCIDYAAKKDEATLPLPAIIILRNGSHAVLLEQSEGQAVLYDPFCKTTLALTESAFLEQWSGQAVLIAKEKKHTEGAGASFGLRWFAPILLRYKRAFGKVLLFSLLIQGFGLISPLFTQVVINKVLVQHSVGSLHVMVAGMIAICVYEAWISGLRSYMLNHHLSKVDVVVSARLFKKLLALPLPFFERQQVGDIVARLREMETIRGFIVGSAFTTIVDSVFALVYLLIMFFYSGYLTLVVLLTLGCYAVLNLALTPLLRRGLKEKFRLGAENQTFLIEAITGIQTVKTAAAEHYFIKKWDEMLSGYVKRVFANANIDNIGNNTATFIQQVSMICILWIGIRQVIDNQLTVGELIAFQMYATAVVSPVLRLVALWQNLQETKEAVARLGEIVNEQAEPTFDPARTTLATISGEIVLDGVTFRYEKNAKKILHDINLQIKAGSRVGIVGRSGSGKSTLAKMIQRLYLPESGRILIDGIDLAQVEPAWLRRQIGVVLQENYLFHGSIKDNIALAKQDASWEEIESAAAIAGVDRFAAGLSKGYDALVGERGTALSGGQKQRIAIARALLTNPRILVFDEATSSLDNEAEELIRNNLGRMAEGRTVLMVAHRLSTIQDCDSIIVMQDGRIVEQGQHEELLAARGEYYRLYNSQQLATTSNTEKRSGIA